MIYGDGVCGVPQCGLHIPGGMLMCRPHWAKVPGQLQGEVYSLLGRWRRGDANLGQLRHAQEAAIRAVK